MSDPVYRDAPRSPDPPTGRRRMAPATEVVTVALLLVAFGALIYQLVGR